MPCFLKTNTQSDRPVMDLLLANIGGYRNPRSLKRLHASDVTKDDFCPRRRVLMVRDDVAPKNEYIAPELQMTFHEGEDKQARINNDYLPNHMHGHWQCSICDTEYLFGLRPERCSNCGSRGSQLYYREPLLTYKKYRFFTGSVDACVDVGGPKLRMVEVKICATSLFGDLKMPLAEHSKRTKLYLHMLENSVEGYGDLIDTQEASVLYVLRGHGKKDHQHGIVPFKEFTVKRNDGALGSILEDVDLIASSGVYDEVKNVTAPKGICSSINDECAKTCPVKTTCFTEGCV